MAPSVICCILLQLFLLVTANDILTINPQNPIVPLGGSIKLNCSINSPSCTTNWKGLDTNLGSVYTAPGYSILTIQNASISMEGIKICIKTCPDRKNLDTHVSLQVYALPETLLLSTGTTNGISYLHCLMKGIYPMVDIDVQCYRDSEKLGNNFEDISYDDELEIFNITWSWEISNEDLKPQTLYRCEAGLSIGEQTFRRVGILEIPKEASAWDARELSREEPLGTSLFSNSKPTTGSKPVFGSRFANGPPASVSLITEVSSITAEMNGETSLFTSSPTPSKSGSSSEYNKQLMSLNCALRDWIVKHVNATPLCDLTPIFRDYEKHLANIEQKYHPGKQNGNASGLSRQTDLLLE